NPLIPDLYFTRSEGYHSLKQRFLHGVPDWSSRSPTAIWRGTTTGKIVSIDNYKENLRIQLVYYCRDYPSLVDAKIMQVRQLRANDAQMISAALKADKLLAEPMRPDEFMNYQYSIDIDGNANAWGLFEKLALGLCVLKIESPWEQWFYPEMKPWVHYVPIRSDLSDLIPTLRDLQSKPEVGERIAKAAAIFALERDLDSEAATFCKSIAAATEGGGVQVV
ncbi:MAG: glycosyl transferase family 90, partial [Candidatus Sulfotelmatobacter sp.]